MFLCCSTCSSPSCKVAPARLASAPLWTQHVGGLGVRNRVWLHCWHGNRDIASSLLYRKVCEGKRGRRCHRAAGMYIPTDIQLSQHTHTSLGQSGQVNLHTAKQRAHLTTAVKTIFFRPLTTRHPGQHQPLYWESDGFAGLSEFKQAEPISYPRKTTQQQHLP